MSGGSDVGLQPAESPEESALLSLVSPELTAPELSSSESPSSLVRSLESGSDSSAEDSAPLLASELSSELSSNDGSLVTSDDGALVRSDEPASVLDPSTSDESSDGSLSADELDSASLNDVSISVSVDVDRRAVHVDDYRNRD